MKTRTAVTLAALTLCISLSASAADPGAAIGAARQAMNAKDYRQAIELLQGAVPDAADMKEPQRSQALAAIHFYTALSFHAIDETAKTREELDQFFLFNPNAGAIDGGKYPKAFIAVFNEARDSRHKGGAEGFELAYPDYKNVAQMTASERTLEQWGDGPDLNLLGTPEEKGKWRTLQSDDDRRAFIESFWKVRDSNLDTPENEARDEFTRRTIFADRTFVTETQRGSMSDRGRVFVLLGPPRLVRKTNLTARDGGGNRKTGGTPNQPGSWQGIDVADRNQAAAARSTVPVAKGRVERWLYGKDQLPKGFPDDQLTFNFITEEGYGENVLQREPMVNKALMDAMKK
jgi:GWxTD domain-containing protein